MWMHEVGRVSSAVRMGWRRLCQSNMTKASEMLAALGGDETLAAQAHAWAQNPEYQGKEVLVARMAAAPQQWRELTAAEGQTPERQRANLAAVRGLANDYAAHCEAFERLPPRTVVDAPADPMRPVPDLASLNASAKAQLSPEFLADMQARGLSYENTGTLVNIRHGQTDGNLVRGGYFAGGQIGPWGAQLTNAARQQASALVPEVNAIAPQIGDVYVSPTHRARQTFALASQGVEFAPGTNVSIEYDFAEHHVGGFFGLKKIDPDAKSRVSGLDGWRIGMNEDGKLGLDKNNLSRDYVAPLDTVYPHVPRVTPVRVEPQAESWNQMYTRVSDALQRDVLPKLAQGRNVLIVSHQYVIGNQDAFFFTGEAARDPLSTGHDLPNTAPQYWTLHIFRNAEGHRIVVPAVAGQGQLAAPGVTPKGQTPPP
jgi:broad specificity phosphatase PhoE